MGSVLANLSTNSQIRVKLRELGALDTLFSCIMCTKNRHLRLELMSAVCNICFSGLGVGLALSDTYLSYLISVLSSKSIKLRTTSVNVLRNASLKKENCEVGCKEMDKYMST